MTTPFETVIGLEVHLQFKTKTKIFCSCANEFGKEPNTHACPVCLGLPGSLPVLNRLALNWAVKVAVSLDCEINTLVKFDRKNYYYPDLPKGYQISQYDFPMGKNGSLEIPSESGKQTIRIRRVHLEEDAGKLIHDTAKKSTFVDYNRAGTPLLEIVSDPDIPSAQEAYDYLVRLKLLLEYLEVSDCDMEKGSLRCDANISLRPWGTKTLGTKTEIKNLNSFKAVKAALEFEEKRHSSVLASGQTVIQETRLWDEDRLMTCSMRSKEEAHDYRYFPEPDLVPFNLDPAVIQEIRTSIPELPQKKYERLKSQYQLTDYETQILAQDKTLAQFFESCHALYPKANTICHWIQGPVLQELNVRGCALNKTSLTPEALVRLLQRIESGVVSQLRGKDILKIIIDSGSDPDKIIQDQGWTQVSDDSFLLKIIDQVIQDNAKAVGQFQQGKESALGFLVGQAMRLTQGKANPKKVNDLIRRRLQHE